MYATSLIAESEHCFPQAPARRPAAGVGLAKCRAPQPWMAHVVRRTVVFHPIGHGDQTGLTAKGMLGR